MRAGARPALPSSDRIAHLLLALREDEEGFATVANHAFAGARWRVRRRLPRVQRPALAAAAPARPEWIVDPVKIQPPGHVTTHLARDYRGMNSAAARSPTPGLPVRRLALIATSGRSDASVRRYRLARLRLEDREVARAERFAHLSAHD